MKNTFSKQYMSAIAELRNLSAAAESLGVTQPALSSYLKKIEKELGTVLFDRNKNPLELTPSGQAYLDYLERACALESAFKQEIADIEGLKVGSLTVGGASFFNVVHLPRAVSVFVERYPGIDLKIVDAQVPELENRAQKGLIDLFLTPRDKEREHFQFEKLLDERIFLCVPPSWSINDEIGDKAFEIRDDGSVSEGEELSAKEFEQLCKQRFILLSQYQDIGQKTEMLFNIFNCRPEKTIRVEQTMTGLALTLSGVGISVLAESSIRFCDFTKRPMLYWIAPDICRRSIFAAYPKNRKTSQAVQIFVELLKETNKLELFRTSNFV